MLKREEWLDLARKLDWEFSYVAEKDVFPPQVSGEPWFPGEAWRAWDEPYRTTYAEYVRAQAGKEEELAARRESPTVDPLWANAVKLYAAVFPLAEFAACVGNLRAARFGRDSAWRSTALFGALDELRHTQLPLRLIRERAAADPRFAWTRGFYHGGNWVAIAARHLADEALLLADPIEFAVATNFVFETGFTNLQFVGLASLARDAGDDAFADLLRSVQTDEARHAQIGPAVLAELVRRAPERAQALVDKWFWRTWHLFAVVTGFAMDYFTPVERRTRSFKEFVEEWIVDQFDRSLKEAGLRRPWYWDHFLESLGRYHHRVYASAYSYRATVWFDFEAPGVRERAWLAAKYPETWEELRPVWERVAQRWKKVGPGVEWGAHGTAIIGFCDLCQLVLCEGTARRNAAEVVDHAGRRYVFCSAPCRWIFERQPELYAPHRGLVRRVLDGDAPGNLLALLTRVFQLDHSTWGKDVRGGAYA